MRSDVRNALLKCVDPAETGDVLVDDPVWELAGRQRLQPLLSSGIRRGARRACAGLVPKPGEIWKRTVARNLLLLASQTRVTHHFDRSNIPCLVLKGVGLCDMAFPDLGCRPTGDIDLLVHRKDVAGAVRLLREMGYAPVGPLPELDRFHEATFSYREGGARVPPVDLHWGLCAERFGLHARFDFDLGEDEVWRNADLKRHRLSPGMILVHVILHAFANSFSMLSDFVDVLYVFRAVQSKLDWEKWVEEVRTFRIGSVAAFTLGRVAEWWGTEFPEVLGRMVEEDLPAASRLGLLRKAPWRGDIGSWKERLAMPLFFQPPARIPVDYLRMVFDLVHFRA